MEQLEDELVRRGLVERHHGRMAEGRVGLIRHAREVGVGNLAVDERANHLDRDLGVGPAEEVCDRLGAQLRPGFGHVKAAVPGKPGQHHITETQRRGLAPGRDIAHRPILQSPAIAARL